MWLRLVAAAALVVGTSAAAWSAPLPPIGQQMDQSPDKLNLTDEKCPGVGNVSGPIAYDRVRKQFVCAYTPTPTSAVGYGNGGYGNEEYGY